MDDVKELSDVQKEFLELRPYFLKALKGITKGIQNLAKDMGLSNPTVYSYLGGKIPDNSRCEFMIKEAKKILTD